MSAATGFPDQTSKLALSFLRSGQAPAFFNEALLRVGECFSL